MSEHDSTRILIERIKRGDPDARDALYQRYQLPVLFLVRVNLGRSLRRKVESWDLVQEALMKSLNDLENFRYEKDDAFKRYLSVKVQQVIRDQADYWGAAKRNPKCETAIGGSDLAGRNTQNEPIDYRGKRSVSEQLELSEDLDQLAVAMDKLAETSTEAWELIVAVKVVGKKLREVAESEGVTVDAIKMRLRRAMFKLAKIYRQLSNEQVSP